MFLGKLLFLGRSAHISGDDAVVTFYRRVRVEFAFIEELRGSSGVYLLGLGDRYALTRAVTHRVALLIGGVGTLVAGIPLFVLGARQRREGTEGLVMGLAGPAPTNVVPLPVPGAVDEQRERRSS